MARSFNGTSDAITATPGAVINGATKLAVVFWMDWTTFANDDDLAMEYSVNNNANAGAFIIDPNGSTGGGGGFFEVGVNGGGFVTLRYFTRPSSGVHSYVFNFDLNVSGAASIPSVYVDGSSQTLTTSAALNNIGSFGNYSLYFMSRAAASLFGAGSMAEAAIYNVNLDAGEAGALARGYSPAFIRPSALLAYWPMVRANLSYTDGMAQTLTGTTISAHPRIIMPAKTNRSIRKVSAPTQLQFIGFMGTSGV